MSSNTGEETTAVKQSQQNSPGPTAESPPDSSTLDTSSRIERLRGWVSAHPLHVETVLALASATLGYVAIPILIFGSFVALGGEEGILAGGVLVAATSLFLLVSLAIALLVHAYTEVRHRPLPADNLDALSVIYLGARAVETVTAVLVLLSLLASVASMALVETVPDLLGLLAVVTGLLLPVIVIVHATGALVGYVLGVR